MRPELFNENMTTHYFDRIKRRMYNRSISTHIKKNIFNIIPFILFLFLCIFLYFKYREKKRFLKITKKRQLEEDHIAAFKRERAAEIEREKKIELEKFYNRFNDENKDKVDGDDDLDFIVDPLEYNLHQKNNKNKTDILQKNISDYHILD